MERFNEMESHARGLFNYWYRVNVLRRTIIWWIIWTIVLWVVLCYATWAIYHANYWYYPYRFQLPIWGMCLPFVVFFLGPTLGYVVSKMTVYWIHQGKIESSFNNEFNIVFESMEELRAHSDVMARFNGVTKEHKSIMKDELTYRLTTFKLE